MLLVLFDPEPSSAAARYKFPLSGKNLRSAKVALAKDTQALRKYKNICKKYPFRIYCDQDGDGISKKLEKQLTTNPSLFDTDFDDINDREEILKSGTNPLVPDNAALSCSPLFFDRKGNTIRFDIPNKSIGNYSRGLQSYAASCKICHGSDEKGIDFTFSELKTRISQPPMNISSLSDSKLADLVAYLNRSRLGQGACSNAPGAATPTPVGTAPFPGCSNEFFASNGDTNAFSIPIGTTGNMSRGYAIFTTGNCSACHSDQAHGRNMGFDIFVGKYQAAVNAGSMTDRHYSSQDFADITAWNNRDAAPQDCAAPMPTITPTADSTRNPDPTATPFACENAVFDATGTTKPGQLNIPVGVSGHIAQGSSLFNLGCTGCHSSEPALDKTYDQFSTLFDTAVSNGRMTLQLNQQERADLVAYFNRDKAPTNCAPLPTPTPLSDFAAGQIVFQANCSGCHDAHWDDFRELTSNKLYSTINDVREMRGISLTSEQVRVLLIYLHNL